MNDDLGDAGGMADVPARQPRFLSIDEANARLPLVRPIVEDLTTLFLDVESRRERLLRLRQRPGKQRRPRTKETVYSEELVQMEEELLIDIDRLQSLTQELTGIDAELEDPRLGYVSFASHLGGREVYLSWKPGESQVGHWYHWDLDYEERVPLVDAPAG